MGIFGIWNGADAPKLERVELVGGGGLAVLMLYSATSQPTKRPNTRGPRLISSPHPTKEWLHGSVMLLLSSIGTYVNG
jgi:hypothetical protein